MIFLLLLVIDIHFLNVVILKGILKIKFFIVLAFKSSYFDVDNSHLIFLSFKLIRRFYILNVFLNKTPPPFLSSILKINELLKFFNAIKCQVETNFFTENNLLQKYIVLNLKHLILSNRTS